MEIAIQREATLPREEFVDLLHRSTLAERRPVHDPATIDRMLQHADVIITARASKKLVGISRALTDYGHCTYLSDLAVDVEHQRKGIGRQLLEETHRAAGKHTTLILLAAPLAREYYPRIGMQPHDSCWIIPGQSHQKSDE